MSPIEPASKDRGPLPKLPQKTPLPQKGAKPGHIEKARVPFEAFLKKAELDQKKR
jgi:hypothetical protein